MTETLKLMCILAHPDDESLGTGGILAKYAAEGVETYLVTATRGERGWMGDEKDDPGLEALGRLRTGELQAAAQVLGLREVNFLDYIDGDLDRALRVGQAAVLFTPDQAHRPLRLAAFLLAPGSILAYNASLERYHLRLQTWVASWLFLRGVPLDRIRLRPWWLCPWKKDRSSIPNTYRILEGRPLSELTHLFDRLIELRKRG